MPIPNRESPGVWHSGIRWWRQSFEEYALMSMLMTISVCALIVSNMQRPAWTVTQAASAAWGLSLLSMLWVAKSLDYGLEIPGALQALSGWGIQWVSYHWLGHISRMTAHLSLFSFDAVVLIAVASKLRGQHSRAGFVVVCGTVSPLVGISLSPRGFSVGEALVMTAIAAAWAQAYHGIDACLRYRQQSHKRLTSYPRREEKLQTQALLWADAAALLSLSPFYTDRLGNPYLAWSFSLSLMYMLVTGLSLIAPMPRGLMAVKIAHAFAHFFLVYSDF
jgi:hypothetical protein